MEIPYGDSKMEAVRLLARKYIERAVLEERAKNANI